MEEKEVDLSGRIVGAVDLPKLDVSPYIGRKTVIASCKYIEGEYNGKPTIYAKLESQTLDILKKTDGTGLDLKASLILGMMYLEGGKVGWGKNSKTAAYLQKMKVNSPDELIGKSVTVQTTYNKNKGQDFLTFV